MKQTFPISITIAAVSFALLYPQHVCAQDASQGAVNSAEPAVASVTQSEGMQMVPAEAALIGKIDARKAQVGQEFRATLSNTVHLKNGPELPHGTQLIGTIASDDTQGGALKLALSFTKAELKDGKVVPIRALIVGLNQPGNDYPGDTTQVAVNNWNDSTQKIDAIGVLSGVDLHSEVAGADSGVFVATKKDDLKLLPGDQFVLAIAARSGSEPGMNGSNGGA
jgi:hypothetical protein